MYDIKATPSGSLVSGPPPAFKLPKPCFWPLLALRMRRSGTTPNRPLDRTEFRCAYLGLARCLDELYPFSVA